MKTDRDNPRLPHYDIEDRAALQIDKAMIATGIYLALAVAGLVIALIMWTR